MLNKKIVTSILYIFILIISTHCSYNEQKTVGDESLPLGEVDTVYKITGSGQWFSVPFAQYEKDRYYPDTIEVREYGHYKMWKGLYKDGSLYFISIIKYKKPFKERKLIKEEQDVAPSTPDDETYQYYFKEMYPDGKLCTEVYFDKGHKIISREIYSKEGKLISRKMKNRNYTEEFYEDGNRKSFSIGELFHILWYEDGHVSYFNINELETVKFYPNGNLAFYERSGIPNAKYTWDLLGQPVNMSYNANYYPQWNAPIQNEKMDSIKSMIVKQDWITGLPNKFNPDNFKFTYFESDRNKIIVNYSDNPANTSIEVYDPLGVLFKVYEDSGERRSKINSTYWDKRNATYDALRSNLMLENMWREYGYNSKNVNEFYGYKIILNKPEEYLKIEIKEHDYKAKDQYNEIEKEPLKYLSIYEANSSGIDTTKLNALLKEQPYPSNSESYLKSLITKLKKHTPLVLHGNQEECEECEESYSSPLPLKTYRYGNLFYYMNNLNYELNDITIKIMASLGDYLVVEYKYFYTVHNSESNAPLSMTEYYLINLKSNSVTPSTSILNSANRKNFDLFLKNKFKKLKIDSLQAKSVLKELVLLPRFQSFDLLIPPDYHYCGEESTMDEDQYINLSFAEMKSFLNLEHPLIKWMAARDKEGSVYNRNQDYFKNIELEDFIRNGISFNNFNNVKADTIIVSCDGELIYKYAINKNGQLTYKESKNLYWEKTRYSYYENGLLKKVNLHNDNSHVANTEPYTVNSHWYFDPNGNLKTKIDSNFFYGCELLENIAHYYNYQNYTYIDKSMGQEKQFYKNELLIGVIKQSEDGNYFYDSIQNKKIVTASSYTTLIGDEYYTYNAFGKLIKREDKLGYSLYEFTYIADGRLIKYEHRRAVENSSYLLDKIIDYQYDSNNRLNKMKIKVNEGYGSHEIVFIIQYK